MIATPEKEKFFECPTCRTQFKRLWGKCPKCGGSNIQPIPQVVKK